MTRLLSLAALCTLAGACTTAAPSWGPNHNVDATAGFMRGSLDTVQNIDDQLAMAMFDVQRDYTYFELHVEGPYGWAMVGIQVDGATLGEGVLAPGSTVTLPGWEAYDGISNGDGEVDGGAVGCSGPDWGDFVFDDSPDDVQLSVGEDPETGGLTVTVDGDWGAAGALHVESPVQPNGQSF